MRSYRLVVAGVVAAALAGCGTDLTAGAGVPECEPSGKLAAMAQAVPSARFVPCIATLPVGWSFAGLEVREGRARFSLANDRVGARAVRVTLEAACDTTGATELLSGDGATRRYLRVDELAGVNRGAWLHRFPGGCVTYDFSVPRDTYDFDAFNVELDRTLGFHSRRSIAEEVERRYGAELDDAPPGT